MCFCSPSSTLSHDFTKISDRDALLEVPNWKSSPPQIAHCPKNSIIRPVRPVSFRPIDPIPLPFCSVRSHWAETSKETPASHDQGCKRSVRRLQVITRQKRQRRNRQWPRRERSQCWFLRSRHKHATTHSRRDVSRPPHTSTKGTTFDCVLLCLQL